MTDRSGQRLGNYRLLHLIGQGGFADVYLAEHIHLNTKAAIKVLQVRLIDSNLEQFRSEARIIANLAHPHIVRVLDFGVEDGIPFLVMEYAPYGTLRQRHPRGPSLPPVSILPYVEQVASALQYAHDRKLIHRDIKPENMLVGHQNDILLSDFGLVVVMQSTDTEKTGHMAGTVAYMAPEQLEGKPRAASDQYSLGIVIYEWLSGARPFQGSFFEIASQHILTSPTPLRKKIPALSPAVEEVVLKALEKEPQQRYTSVQEFATAFAQACQLERFSPTTYPGVNNPLNQPLPAIAPALSESETTPSIDPATLDSAATMPDSADISANPPTPQNDEVISPAEFQLPRQGISRRRIITGAGVTLIGAGLTWMGLSIFSPAPIFLHIAGTTSRSTSTPSTCPTTTSATPTPSAGPPTPPPVTNTPVSLSDGLQYIDIKIGCGPGVQTKNNVSVEYTGWLQSNRKKFDSSYDRQASPFTFVLGTGQVIKGFDEGLVGMKPGGIRRLIIPPALGYGSQGSPPTIPPNATLVFDVTLLNVR